MPSVSASSASAGRVVAAALLGAATLLLAGCQLVGIAAKSWSTTTTNDVGGPHVIRVTDHTGRVADLRFDPPDADLFGGVSVAPGVPNALDVTWTGGSCDAATEIEITARGAGLAVDVTVTGDGNPCDAMGIPRVVRLTLTQPLPPDAVVVSQ
jgi:hypothetical protein